MDGYVEEHGIDFAAAGETGTVRSGRMVMKAMVRTRYGPPEVLQLAEVEKPVPAENEVLIKLCAAAVNPMDSYILRGTPILRRLPGMSEPKHKIIGCDIAGRVEAVGGKVTQFRVGDEVFGGKGAGGLAEYVCVPEGRLALKPAKVTFEEAAGVTVAGLTALQGLRDKGQLRAGQKVVVDGASGGVGTFAVQVAKALGAEVTAVCSTGKMETARAIGADHVIDYTREDFTKNGQRYDLIFGANSHHSIGDYWRAMSDEGIYLIVGGALGRILPNMLLAPVFSRTGKKKACFFIANINSQDLNTLKEWLETGKIATVIDRRYPLSQAADAMRYLEERHARGKIVITMGNEN